MAEEPRWRVVCSSSDTNNATRENCEAYKDDDDPSESEEWECGGLSEGHENGCKSVAYLGTGTLIATCNRAKSTQDILVVGGPEVFVYGVSRAGSQKRTKFIVVKSGSLAYQRFKDNDIQPLEGIKLVLNVLRGFHCNMWSKFFWLSLLLGDPGGFVRVRMEIDSAVENPSSWEAILQASPSGLDDPSSELLNW
ncbi:hypothetical protein L210DRAFT_3506582 [Boletus edulis BED1]|uniref:Uncharacterized protein n=1 Tax=Boletus edulis BED1 TaxID=1328754 RepID=A0AAD4BM33_BOLED|nr:hypothetical protein L210DRAFT_3506582 [Boletus edulis BED1]